MGPNKYRLVHESIRAWCGSVAMKALPHLKPTSALSMCCSRKIPVSEGSSKHLEASCWRTDRG